MKYDPNTHAETPMSAYYGGIHHDCESCGDREYFILFKVDNGYRHSYHVPCPHCGKKKSNPAPVPVAEKASVWEDF